MGDIDFSVIHEVEAGLQIIEPNPGQIEEGMLVGILFKYLPEERRAGRENQFVSLELFGAHSDGAVEQVLLLSDLPEGRADICLKVVPSKTELFTRSHFGINFYLAGLESPLSLCVVLFLTDFLCLLQGLVGV